MALHDLTLLSKVVEDRVAKTTLQSAILLQQLYLAGRMKTKSNTSIDWDVLVDDGGVAIEPVTQDGANTAVGTVVPANLRIGRYRVKHQFMVNRVDIKEAAARSQAIEIRCPKKIRPNQVLLFSAIGSTRCHAETLTDDIVEKIRCGSAYAGEKPLPNEDYKASQECVKRFYDY